MLINATQAEEIRVAIVDGQNLFDLDLEVPSREQKKSNIYKARITRVEPSLEACFIDYGGERNGFLSLKEVAREYFQPGTNLKSNIRDMLKEGQEILVQVDKEERGNKGAALTSFISLAGRYLVLMPNSPNAGGVSRRIEGEERTQLKEAMEQLKLPDGMGFIIRTNGMGRELEELQWDLDYLVKLWSAIKQAAEAKSAPFLVYQESKLIIRALRDYLRADIGEVLIDDESMFNEARDFAQQVMPANVRKLKLYSDTTPLFTRYQIESQIETAFSRNVRLPSGGAIVIDHTEALTAIDINSARATKGGDIEETALRTNLEAADEVARQLRIRDLGGLVVIDFIDMENPRHQREVEERLKEALKIDRARVQVGRISRFGLLEMSRQRLRPSLGEASEQLCPRCHGQGRIRGVESTSLAILRLVEEEALKDNTEQVIVQAPADVANFLVNEKRAALQRVEQRHDVPVVIVANPHMETPDYRIERLRTADLLGAGLTPSYKRVEAPPVGEAVTRALVTQAAPPTAAVSGVTPSQPAPVLPEPAKEVEAPPAALGFFARIVNFFKRDRRARLPAPQAPNHKAGSRDNQRNAAKAPAQQGAQGASGNQQKQHKDRRPDGRRDQPQRDRGHERNQERRPDSSRHEGQRGEGQRHEGHKQQETRAQEQRQKPKQQPSQQAQAPKEAKHQPKHPERREQGQDERKVERKDQHAAREAQVVGAEAQQPGETREARPSRRERFEQRMRERQARIEAQQASLSGGATEPAGQSESAPAGGAQVDAMAPTATVVDGVIAVGAGVYQLVAKPAPSEAALVETPAAPASSSQAAVEQSTPDTQVASVAKSSVASTEKMPSAAENVEASEPVAAPQALSPAEDKERKSARISLERTAKDELHGGSEASQQASTRPEGALQEDGDESDGDDSDDFDENQDGYANTDKGSDPNARRNRRRRGGRRVREQRERRAQRLALEQGKQSDVSSAEAPVAAQTETPPN
jgi:ribonuclease E